MIVSLSDSHTPVLVDERNFKALAVQLQYGLQSGAVVSALGAIGRVEGAHAWLSIAALSALGPGDAGWQTSFEAMIAYADRAGWVSADKAFVRAHIDSEH